VPFGKVSSLKKNKNVLVHVSGRHALFYPLNFAGHSDYLPKCNATLKPNVVRFSTSAKLDNKKVSSIFIKEKFDMASWFMFFFISLSFAMLLPLKAGIIEVPNDQPTIQAGIDAAMTGDTVLVAPGVYFENINFNGKNIVVASHYILNHDPALITTTIINGSTPTYPDTASCVLIVSGEDSTAVLEGFTITEGNGTRWEDEHGPGNFYREGGGILIQASAPTIRHNMIINNHASDKQGLVSAGGGAIRCGDGNPRILNNLIMFNDGLYGGGIVLNYSGAIIKNNIIARNSGGQDYGGAGIWILSNGLAPKIVENNTVMENNATGSGTYGGKGGGFLLWSTTVMVRNNIVWGNTQSTGGPIAVLGGGASVISYSNVEGGFTGEGNIDLAPAFADSGYYLSDISPCIDAGNPDVIYNDPEDSGNPGFAAWPSLGMVRNDMGAYGGPLRDIFPPFIITGLDPESHLLPGEFGLEQNFPNPFNPTTSIKYQVKSNDLVRLVVYDLLGRQVKTLVNEAQPAGNYQVVWDGTDDRDTPVSSGIYIYRIMVDHQVYSRKMVLLR
jgi:hypothetical protein